MSVGEYIRNSQIWKSVFRHPAPYDRRNRAVVMLTNFFLHLHPVSIKKQGIALSVHLVHGRRDVLPVPGRNDHRRAADVLLSADAGVGVITTYACAPRRDDAGHHAGDSSLGCPRDGDHRLAAHVPRVSHRFSYKPPREFNWVIGVLLLVLTLLLSFTGYLLPWDQLAIWAITVGSNMARATPFLGL